MSQEQDRQHFVPFYVQQHFSRIREGVWADWCIIYNLTVIDNIILSYNLILAQFVVWSEGRNFATLLSPCRSSPDKKKSLFHLTICLLWDYFRFWIILNGTNESYLVGWYPLNICPAECSSTSAMGRSSLMQFFPGFNSTERITVVLVGSKL